MAIAAEELAAGAEEGGAASSAVRTSQRMPRAGGYLTRAQVGQLNSDSAEYDDMRRREAGRGRARAAQAGRAAASGTRTAAKSAGGTVRTVNRSVTTSSGRANIGTKMVFAVFAALVALELATWATGRKFSIRIPPLNQPAPKQRSYWELYKGQTADLAGFAAAPAAAQTFDPAAQSVQPGIYHTVGQYMSAQAAAGAPVTHGPLP